MKNIRWYDKNPDLKEVFDFIQGLDNPTKKEIAKDIIQILMKDFKLNLDEEIKRISEDYTYTCKRWYDYNIDLFTSFEIIRGFSKEFQQQVIQKIIESALLIYLEKEDVNNA